MGDDLDLVTLENVLVCIECERPWTDAGERWRVYLTDDLAPRAIPYCADCAHREFDPD
jgi:hypothetical protein